MYSWIWRHLPGPLLLRVGQSLLLLAGVLALLFFVVFPRVEAALPYSDVTVAPTSQPTVPPTTQPTSKP